MKKLAIIPARGGSKRIKRKNVKSFLGKPILQYSITAAKRSKLFDEIMVSTEDMEIGQVALENGASVPFYRSDENADDFATTAQVIQEVIKSYEKQNIFFDQICCIYPTAPLITPNRLIEGHKLLNKHNYEVVFPVVPFSYPIQRSLKMKDTQRNQIGMLWPENQFQRSQDLETTYHDAGQFYWISREKFKNHLYPENCGAIVLNELEVQDIDTIEDWQLAELKYQLSVHH
ncbi:pseudaminic acid cytidylyltransferase [Reichenbachiella sp.]|uniref:pseudaminic acid cytidylyltransferase n=1 Tax=Reichenbachiella sp. TaxID=2184521 RepID=UPI003BB1CB0B